MPFSYFKDLIYKFVDFFLDRRCVVCGSPLPYNRAGLCQQCECEYNLFSTPILKYKGNPLEEKLYGLAKVETACALMKFYEGSPAQTLIHQLKYHNERSIGRLLGDAIAHQLQQSNRHPRFDYVIPVPLHPNRIRTRGYNQSELIAREISHQLLIPLSTSNLYRTRDNQTQTRRSPSERAENVRDLFSLHDPRQFDNKNVLLIDDVFTTGSTIIDCCRALNHSTDIKIHIYTAAAVHAGD